MTVLLLHGLGSDRQYMLDVFGPVLATLAPGERVIAPDVRAHGASPLVGAPADFALDAAGPGDRGRLRRLVPAGSDAVARPRLRLDSAAGLTVVGVSMGAAIALRMALAGRIRIDRALFVRPSFTDGRCPRTCAPSP